jgi:hypothetical protein
VRFKTETRLIVVVGVTLLLGGCVARTDDAWKDFRNECRIEGGIPQRTDHIFVEPAPWEGWFPWEWECVRFSEG